MWNQCTKDHLYYLMGLSYDPRREIGSFMLPWTDQVSERYNKPNQIAISTVVGVAVVFFNFNFFSHHLQYR